MNTHTLVRTSLAGMVAGAVVVGLALGAFAAAPRYALKVRVTDKSESAKVFEGFVLQQTRGATTILGDQLNVRILSGTTAFTKNGKKQSTKSWLSALKNEDAVSVTGGYRKSDNTFEAQKVVNRSR